MESTRLTALAHGCHQADAASRTELAVSSLREGQKREKKLREELSGYLAGDLIQQAKENGGKAILVRDDEELEALTAISNSKPSPPVAVLKRSDGADDEPTELKDSAPAEYTFVLASNVSTGSCPILITGQDTAEVAEKLKKAFEGKLRGGGKGRWQGKLEGKLNKKEVEALKAAVYQE